MNQTGHIKDTKDDSNGFRQFIINCVGITDQRKYFSISPFGVDYNAPIDTRSLTVDSRNKDQSFNIGVLNKVKVDDLEKGECAIFSTDEAGENIVSKSVYRNTGDIEINKGESNGNILIKADGTIEFNGNSDNIVGFTDLKSGFDVSINDLNNTISELNKIITALLTWIPVPNDGGAALKALISGNPPASLTPSTASIDSSKKDNLKTE